jgi:prepilin-type N-terminal cleavage/methylation domain-containing protein
LIGAPKASLVTRFDSTRNGFTLIELVIALAIIGVLTSAAIPSFLRYQLRSRSSEALVNLSAIARTQGFYFAEHGEFVGVASPVPAIAPGSSRSAWTPGSDFDTLGWAPEGGVQFQYQVVADTDGAGSVRFTAASEQRFSERVPCRANPTGCLHA